MSYVLVIVTANGCGHCTALKSKLPSIKDALNSAARSSNVNLSIVDINLETMRADIDVREYPAALRRFIRWYPFVLIVPSTDYKAALASRSLDAEFRATIFGVGDDGKPKHSPEKDNLVGWLVKYISNNASTSTVVKSVTASTPSTSESIVRPTEHSHVCSVVMRCKRS